MKFLRFVLAFCGMLNIIHEHLRFMFEIRSLILLLSLLYVSFFKIGLVIFPQQRRR